MVVISVVNILLLAAGVSVLTFMLVLLVKILLKTNKALDIWLAKNKQD